MHVAEHIDAETKEGSRSDIDALFDGMQQPGFLREVVTDQRVRTPLLK
jgi:hypothetical protein